MALSSKHPAYIAMQDRWRTMRDTFAGEDQVKSQGELYLPTTEGMKLDGLGPSDPGRIRYDAYKARAVFHDFVSDGVKFYLGLLHQKKPSINVPKQLEPMLEDLTVDHLNAEELLRKVNEQQLLTGRYGMLLDIPTNPVVTEDRPLLPYVATYAAEAILNWDSGDRQQKENVPLLNLVVLDESGYKRKSTFEWQIENAYRVLMLGDALQNEAEGQYRQGLFTGAAAEFSEASLIAPMIRGKTLERIPFVFVNAQDNLPNPDLPPLLGLARLSLAVYRLEADYRQNLFMQGQDTLVVIGGKDGDEYRTGAGNAINIRATPGADAKFIGVSGTGLSEQREALENDKMAARNKAGQLIDTRSKAKESGDALNTRVAAQTATLNAVAYSGASALAYMLEQAAIWVGANPKDVDVTPNTEWTEEAFLPADLQALMTAKKLGAPLSLETIHDIMLDRGMTEKDFEEEMRLIGEEAPTVVGTDAGGNPVDDKGNSRDPKTGEIKNGPMIKPVSAANDPEADKPKGKAPMSKGAKANQKGAKK